MANVLKKAFFGLMEKAFTNEGYVSEVRKWDLETLCEIDLHLPTTDMGKWSSIQRLICKVSDEGDFRDYTPAKWNAERKVCTLFIETGHPGPGSLWAKNLQAGDTVSLAVAPTVTAPTKAGKLLCLGDLSSLGHFLALKQLTNRNTFPLETIIALNKPSLLPTTFVSENREFKFVTNAQALQKIAENKQLSEYTSIYLAGNIPMITELRKKIKKNPYLTARIMAHGFWS